MSRWFRSRETHAQQRKARVVHYLFVSFLTMSAAIGQPDEPEELPEPCQHPVIQKAKREGLNSLTLKEIPQFWVMSFLCKREAKRKGEDVNFRDLLQAKQKQNFEEARKLSGIGTCCLTVTVLVMTYAYVGVLMGAD